MKRLRRALYRLYYRVKYFPFAAERREGKDADSAAREERGFIVVQIDALAHDDFQRALEQGYCPRLKRLIEREGWELRRYPAGLPSATPAAQGAIFYGTKDDIPAFRWYEKQDRRVIIGSKPADVQYVRDRLPQEGILTGGTSYVNIYDGGAEHAYFTLSARTPRRFLENIGGGRLMNLLTGNLSHQIEHHFYPDVPAHRYGALSLEVREICARYGQPYNTGSLFKQFGEVMWRIVRHAFPSRPKRTPRMPAGMPQYPMMPMQPPQQQQHQPGLGQRHRRAVRRLGRPGVVRRGRGIPRVRRRIPARSPDRGR